MIMILTYISEGHSKGNEHKMKQQRFAYLFSDINCQQFHQIVILKEHTNTIKIKINALET